jgi:hypothetical protein
MATTDAKSGFRLPWSSDRTTDEPTTEVAASTDEAPAVSDTQFAVDPWTGQPVGGAAATTDSGAPAGGADVDHAAEPAASPGPGPTRKQNKFLADLTKAMQAAAEEARGRSLSQLEADAKAHVEAIHARSATESANLRRTCDDDVQAVREWSKAEIARVREETEHRITDRKGRLESEIEEHAAVIEREIETVQKTVTNFEEEMAYFFERLLAEEDPTRFATMAENLPEPPTFDDLSAVAEAQAEVEAVAEVATTTDAGEQEPEAEALAETVGTVEDPTADGAAWTDEAGPDADASLETGTLETVEESTDETAATDEASAETVGEAETVAEAEPVAEADGASDHDGDQPVFDGSELAYDGTGEGLEGDGEVDREAAFAAIQAAAEAAASAEVAADAAARAEAVADVAIEIMGHEPEGEADPRFTALGLNPDDPAPFIEDAETDEIPTVADDDLATRLNGLVPGKGKGGSDATATQVVVVGLVSVASIASFKRHLGRVSGVQSVGVSSGPDGEFVFAVTHTADANLRDAVPSLPSFQARVTSASDGVVHVTAHDPEADG